MVGFNNNLTNTDCSTESSNDDSSTDCIDSTGQTGST